MNKLKAKEWLGTRQTELQELLLKQTAAAEELAELEAKRDHANEMLTTGDLHQQKVVDELDLKIEPLKKNKLPGLAGLIAKTEKAIVDAKVVVDDIAARDHAAALVGAEEKETQDCERIRAGLPVLERRLFELHVGLCLALGEYEIALARIGPGPLDTLDGRNLAFRERMRTLIRGENLALLDHPGVMTKMPAAPMIRTNGGAPHQGPVNLAQHVNRIKSQAKSAFLKEIENG